MRKKTYLVVFLSICILGYGYHVIPEYKIKSSISFDSPSGRDTVLNVVVYKNYYSEGLPAEIEKFYLDMNDCPTALQMNLYLDGWKKPYRVERFEYRN